MGEEVKESVIKPFQEKRKHFRVNKKFSIIAVATAFVITIAGLSMNRQIQGSLYKFYNEAFWPLKPNSIFLFNKIDKNRPNLKIAPIKGNIDNFRSLNTYVAYDKNNIYIYDSYCFSNLISIIRIEGTIDYVSCFLTTYGRMLDYPSKDQENCITPRIPDGFYINYQYTDKLAKKWFSSYFIPQASFDLFAKTKFMNKLEFEKTINELKNNNNKTYYLYPIPDEQIQGTTIAHPGKLIKEIMKIPFDYLEFIGMNFGKLGVIEVIAKDNSAQSVVVLNDKGAMKSSFKVDHPFITYFCYHTYEGEIHIFDGFKMFGLTVVNGVLEIDKNIEINLGSISNAKFIPSSVTDYANYYFPLISCEEKLIYIDPLIHEPIKHTIYDFPINTKLMSYNNVIANNKSYLIRYTHDNMKYIEYNTICQYYSSYSLRYTVNWDNAEIIWVDGIHLNLCQDVKTNKPAILYDINNEIYIGETYGVDEPVDEAHVTYEDNRLTIYFMNKNSVYRWQNSEKGIDNLKLRKLDITPEPIVTTKQ